MITILFRTLVLFVHAHALWPAAPVDRVLAASYVAAASETHAVPAEFLLAIAQHESDLQPSAVSWRFHGAPRVDIAWDGIAPIPRGGMACGLVSSIAPDRPTCAALLEPARAMAAGVAELAEELDRCRGVMACALSIYAGGRRGLEAWRAGDVTDATRFAYYFIATARRLGWAPGKRPTS